MMHTSFDRNNRRNERLRAKREAEAVRRRAQHHARELPQRRRPTLPNPFNGVRGWWYRRQLAKSYHTRMLPVPGARTRLLVIGLVIAFSVALGALLASLFGAGQRLQPAPLVAPAPSAASPAARPSAAASPPPAGAVAAPRSAPATVPGSAPALSIDVGGALPTRRVAGVGELGLLLRAEPDRAAEALKTLGEGVVVVVTGEAVERDGARWLPVRAADGSEGWVAEAYLATDPAAQ